VQHMMQEAHDYLQRGGDAFDSSRSFALGRHGEGTFSMKGDAGVDLANGDATREVSFTFTEQFDLGHGKSVSLSFAFAEEDNLASGKSQIATGFGLAEGHNANSFATADAGSAGANSLDFGNPLHQPDAFAYA
jgi:hypothetical protein